MSRFARRRQAKPSGDDLVGRWVWNRPLGLSLICGLRPASGCKLSSGSESNTTSRDTIRSGGPQFGSAVLDHRDAAGGNRRVERDDIAVAP